MDLPSMHHRPFAALPVGAAAVHAGPLAPDALDAGVLGEVGSHNAGSTGTRREPSGREARGGICRSNRRRFASAPVKSRIGSAARGDRYAGGPQRLTTAPAP